MIWTIIATRVYCQPDFTISLIHRIIHSVHHMIQVTDIQKAVKCEYINCIFVLRLFTYLTILFRHFLNVHPIPVSKDFIEMCRNRYDQMKLYKLPKETAMIHPNLSYNNLNTLAKVVKLRWKESNRPLCLLAGTTTMTRTWLNMSPFPNVTKTMPLAGKDFGLSQDLDF